MKEMIQEHVLMYFLGTWLEVSSEIENPMLWRMVKLYIYIYIYILHEFLESGNVMNVDTSA
jgi:hypothetical protein